MRLEQEQASGVGAMLPATDIAYKADAGIIVIGEGSDEWPEPFLEGLVADDDGAMRITVRSNGALGSVDYVNSDGEVFWRINGVPISWSRSLFPTTDTLMQQLYSPDHVELTATFFYADDYVSWQAKQELLAQLHPKRAPPLRSPTVNDLQITSFSMTSNAFVFGVAWPEGTYLPYHTLDLYGTEKLAPATWDYIRFFDCPTFQTNCSVTLTLPYDEVPFYPTNNVISHTHDESCSCTTNIVESAIEAGTYYTNIVWSCANASRTYFSGFFRFGTLRDTDDDWMTDAYELLVAHTDPHNRDTDSDGLFDGEEYFAGTSPTMWDTDGDRLGDGWESTHDGYDPLVNNDTDDNPDNDADADPDDDDLTNFQEMLVGTDPANPDTDGDGLDDGVEHALGTNPRKSDMDGDGLSDGDEVLLGTNPALWDTDGDGLNDWWESLQSGFNPLVNNEDDSDPDNDADADPDNDGLTNLQEMYAGTSPWETDTDGDDVDDTTEIEQGTDPKDKADSIPVKWVLVTGDLDENIEKHIVGHVEIPAGTAAFVGVFLASDEYPGFTEVSSEYNDRLEWTVSATGFASLSGDIRVNNVDSAWDLAKANGQTIHGLTPVVLEDCAIFTAPSNSAIEVTVDLKATNISDGALPSTVAVGFFPINVVQANMPQGTGRHGTTDSGNYSRASITTNRVAYITGVPEVPALTARIKDFPAWTNVTWSGELVSERPDRRMYGIDDRTLEPETLAGDEPYNITEALGNEIIGGRCTLNISVGSVSANYPFSIRGKNPLDATARAYIDSTVDPEFLEYAWIIAKHESKARGNRVYNQFNANEEFKELPNWGSPDGWGMCQIDKGPNGDSAAEVYNWQENVRSMNAKLREGRANYHRFVGYYRDLYANNAGVQWSEPDNVSTTIAGRVVSAEEWSIMTFYNGAGGCPKITLDGGEKDVPIEFNPQTSSWILHPNRNDYVTVAITNRNQQVTE